MDLIGLIVIVALAQLIWICVAAVVVIWLLSLFGIWSPPR